MSARKAQIKYQAASGMRECYVGSCVCGLDEIGLRAWALGLKGAQDAYTVLPTVYILHPKQ